MEAAYQERVSLSEWVRRRCDAGLVAGEGEAVVPIGTQPGAASRDLRLSPATSPERSFRPDPKGGLVAGDKPGGGVVRDPGHSRARPAPGSPAASSCPGDAPAGTRCKLCGKKH